MRFLLIRPIEESFLLAKKLEEQGHFSITSPVLKIEEELPKSIDLSPYQALIFTSAIAVRIYEEHYGVSKLPIYAVGKKTAACAASLGFTNIHYGAGDVNKLAQLINSQANPSEGPLLYLSAADIAQDLKELLKNDHFQLKRTILYRATEKTTFEERAINALLAGKIDYIPFYSSRSALIFKEIIKNKNLVDYLNNVIALCLSINIENKVCDLPWNKIITANKPNEEELFNLIGINL